MNIREFSRNYSPNKELFFKNISSFNKSLIKDRNKEEDIKKQAVFIISCYRLLYKLLQWNKISGREIYETMNFREKSYINIGILNYSDVMNISSFEENMEITNENRNYIVNILTQISIYTEDLAKKPLPRRIAAENREDIVDILNPISISIKDLYKKHRRVAANDGIEDDLMLIYQDEKSTEHAEKLYKAYNLYLGTF